MWQDLYIHSIGAGNPFYQAWTLFSSEIWKMLECHFWANVMLRQSCLWASRATPAQKSQSLRVVCSKNFSRATFFVFWVTWWIAIWVICPWNKFEEKAQCEIELPPTRWQYPLINYPEKNHRTLAFWSDPKILLTGSKTGSCVWSLGFSKLVLLDS